MAKRSIDRIEIQISSGNVFADLGLRDADKLKIKSGLVIEITRAGAPVAVISPPRLRLIGAARFRELLGAAPPVDRDFADDVRAIRAEVGPPESPWPS